MNNPGMIYFMGALLLYIFKGRIQQLIAVATPLVALSWIRFLPGQNDYVVSYLDFELVFFQYNRISRVIAIIFVVFGLMAVIYALALSNKKQFVLMNLYIGSSIAILFCGDFLTFLIFWELMTITSYFLIYNGKSRVLKKSSLYYLVLQIIGGVSLLLGIVIQYQHTGSLHLMAPAHGIPFFALAVGIKLAFIGFHYWLPKNYSRVPFHLSVILSAYTTKVGVYAFYRLMDSFKVEYIGLIPAVVGVILALKQIQLRKILSYHLISQTGYMLTGIALGTELGINGGFFHVVNHILYKGLLFMAAGAVIYATGKEDLKFLGGLYRKLPLTTLSAFVGSLAISGFPFLNGYLSKLLIKKSASSNPLVYYGLMIASVGTAISFLKFMYFTFFQRGEVEVQKNPTRPMQVGMVIGISLIVFIGLNPVIFNVFFSSESGPAFFTMKNIFSGLLPILLGLLLFYLFLNLLRPDTHHDQAGGLQSILQVPDMLLEKLIYESNYNISARIYNIFYVEFQGQLFWIVIMMITFFIWVFI